METRRTANVARTAYDLKHFNRPRAPDFWLVKLWLKVGGNSSKSYLSPDAPNASAASSGSDDFHFAPEKEKPDINYESTIPSP